MNSPVLNLAPGSQIQKIIIEGIKGTGRNTFAQAITLATQHRMSFVYLEKLLTHGFSLSAQIAKLVADIDEHSTHPLMIILLALDTLERTDQDAAEELEYIVNKAELSNNVTIMGTIFDIHKLLPFF